MDQGCPKWVQRTHFTWPAVLLSNGAAHGPPKTGLRFYVGATAISRYLGRSVCFDVLGIEHETAAKECFKP